MYLNIICSLFHPGGEENGKPKDSILTKNLKGYFLHCSGTPTPHVHLRVIYTLWRSLQGQLGKGKDPKTKTIRQVKQIKEMYLRQNAQFLEWQNTDAIIGTLTNVEGCDHVQTSSYVQCAPIPHKRNTGPSMEYRSARVAWLGNPMEMSWTSPLG